MLRAIIKVASQVSRGDYVKAIDGVYREVLEIRSGDFGSTLNFTDRTTMKVRATDKVRTLEKA